MPETISLTRKAFVGTSWSALSNIARQVLSFFSVAILARLLGPSAYGLMGMATPIGLDQRVRACERSFALACSIHFSSTTRYQS